MDKVQVTVSLDEAHIGQINQVADQLRAAGLEVDQVLSTIGIVTGSIEADIMPSLSQVDGVESVEQGRTYKLAPPNSDLQ